MRRSWRFRRWQGEGGDCEQWGSVRGPGPGARTRSEESAVPMTFRSAQREPVGMLTCGSGARLRSGRSPSLFAAPLLLRCGWGWGGGGGRALEPTSMLMPR